MSTNPSLVWFRNDLRIADNPALAHAAALGAPVACVYVLDEGGDRRPLGGALKWWLHHALAALADGLAAHGVRLTFLRGDPARLIPELAAHLNAGTVCWNRRYGGPERALDSALKVRLRNDGREVASFNASLLNEPWQVRSATGQPYKVFTPFWRAARALGTFAAAAPAPSALPPSPPGDVPGALPLAALGLRPTAPDWAGGLAATWTPGEDGARRALESFLTAGLDNYATLRDRPDLSHVSRLSPHLAFGEIGPRQIVQALDFHDQIRNRDPASTDRTRFEAELGWREFAYHLFYEQPDLATHPFNPRFAAIDWQGDATAFRAWCRGQTGYPLIDAGMRELWQTGFVHNRVRMVVASFLIKHLQVDWRQGEAWFWDTLVDADPASNPFNWQWVAGCGADAAPYYRIFNPVLQSEKFDPSGEYVRRFVPELVDLPAEFIHAPWLAPPAVLARHGVRLGETYPRPIVNHAVARARALAAYHALP